VLPRRRLDALLVAHAQAQGARLHTPWRFEHLIEDRDTGPAPGGVEGVAEGPAAPGGRVRGARLRQPGTDRVADLAADWVVLATGAAAPALQAAGLCARREPSGVALRGYVRNPALAGRPLTMDVVWHRALRPGYGWVFPCGDDVYNIGVGAFFRRGRAAAGGADRAGLREMFEAFTRVHPPARALLAGGEWVGELKGAPLRCTLSGAHRGRPGLLAVGEAIGSTYDFTGEGIGKALETGLLAARALLRPQGAVATDSRQSATHDAAVLRTYDAALDALRPRFALYERANGINRHPWLADLVIWRAQRSPGLRQRMSGVLEETTNPGSLLSLRGLWRLVSV
jgi:flavin-dependent dehydrogenase